MFSPFKNRQDESAMKGANSSRWLLNIIIPQRGTYLLIACRQCTGTVRRESNFSYNLRSIFLKKKRNLRRDSLCRYICALRLHHAAKRFAELLLSSAGGSSFSCALSIFNSAFNSISRADFFWYSSSLGKGLPNSSFATFI